MVTTVAQRLISRFAVLGVFGCWFLTACAPMIGFERFGREPGPITHRSAAHARAEQLVVMLESSFQVGRSGYASGAGVVFYEDDTTVRIVTANHLVRTFVEGRTEVADTVSVRFAYDRHVNVAATVLDDYSGPEDLAIIEVDRRDIPRDASDFQFDIFHHAAELKVGSKVFPMGNPEGNEWGTPYIPDRVNRVRKYIDFESNFVTFGHSGGGLFDKSWRLVGLILSDDGESLYRAVPIEFVSAYLRRFGYPIGDLHRKGLVAPGARERTSTPLELMELADAKKYVILEGQLTYVPSMPLAQFRNFMASFEVGNFDSQEVGLVSTEMDGKMVEHGFQLAPVLTRDLAAVLDIQLFTADYIGTGWLGLSSEYKDVALTEKASVETELALLGREFQLRLLPDAYQNKGINALEPTVALWIKARYFHPDQASDDDWLAAGANDMTEERVVVDRVDWNQGDATDYYRIAPSDCTRKDNGRFLVWIEGHEDVKVEVRPTVRKQRFKPDARLSNNSRLFSFHCAGVEQTVKVQAPEFNTAADYRIIRDRPSVASTDAMNLIVDWLRQSDQHTNWLDAKVTGTDALVDVLSVDAEQLLKSFARAGGPQDTGNLSRVLQHFLLGHAGFYQRFAASCCAGMPDNAVIAFTLVSLKKGDTSNIVAAFPYLDLLFLDTELQMSLYSQLQGIVEPLELAMLIVRDSRCNYRWETFSYFPDTQVGRLCERQFRLVEALLDSR